MHIEYLVPLKMLDESVACTESKKYYPLVGRSTVSKCQQVPALPSEILLFGSGGSGRSGRSGGGFNRGGSGGNNSQFSQADREKMTEPQKFLDKIHVCNSGKCKGL